jgi:hypothetical protein
MKRALATGIPAPSLDEAAMGHCVSLLQKQGLFLHEIRRADITPASYLALTAAEVKQAIQSGDTPAVRSCIEHGFNPNVLVAVFEEEVTLEEYARIWGRYEIARYLSGKTSGDPVARLSDNERKNGVSHIRYETGTQSTEIRIGFGRCAISEKEIQPEPSGPVTEDSRKMNSSGAVV